MEQHLTRCPDLPQSRDRVVRGQQHEPRGEEGEWEEASRWARV